MIPQQLNKLATMLAASGSTCKYNGLAYGKMGIAIFFFHYARYKDNMLFTDNALKLIEEIQAAIYVNSPLSYMEGLTGIGTGIEYIAQRGFLDIDTDDILDDFDKMFAEKIHRNRLYLSYPVLIDMKRYFSARLENPETKSKDFLNRTMNDLLFIMELHERVFVTFEEMPQKNRLTADNPDNLGLEGLAGKGLALLAKLNPEHETWEFLL